MSITFHLFDAFAQDQEILEQDDSETKDAYAIHLFGCTTEGKSLRITATGFNPFFYIQLPAQKNALAKLQERVSRELEKKRMDSSVVEIRKCQKAPMYGYTGGKDITVAEIKTSTRKIFYEMRKLFLNERSQPIFKLFPDSPPLKVYDAMLDPMLRFFHLRNIQPCGWVEAKVELETDDDGLTGVCDWEDISPVEKPPMPSAPLLMNFWDIECYSASGDFPLAEKGDPIIQIGNVYVRQGSPTERHIFVLDSCDAVPGTTVHCFKTEKEMLLAWASHLSMMNPDILVGYNIFGFDEKYVWHRAERLGLTEKPAFQSFNRLASMDQSMKLVEKFLSSSALGDNYLYMWNTAGRLQIDLYHYIRRSASLGSYKLDDVAKYYMSGKLSGVDTKSMDGKWIIKTKQTGDVIPGRYIVLLDETGEDMIDKTKVLSVEPGKHIVVEIPEGSEEEDMSEAVLWAVVKDDCPPAEIFRLYREGGSEGRAFVAKYCIQDCDLVYELYKKLDVFNNAMSMANVCSVPVNYIFTRGQGIKIESLIFKECYERNMVIEVLDSPARYQEGAATEEVDEEPKEDSYEGAIVLDPIPGFYSESPIGVCDFASLYPSTIISENISHDSLVWAKDFDLEGNLIAVNYGSIADENNAPPGTRWTDISFDIWRDDPNDKRMNPEKIKVGVRVCRYAQKPDGTKHTLPDIVAKLLAARKRKRKEAEKETEPFRKALLDAEQLAYKLTANSLYGQLGSSTFKVRLVHLAASTTAYGRLQILFAKAAIERFYGPEAKDPRCSASITYGDTDSLFVDFGVKNPITGEKLSGTEAVEATMHITEEAGKFITGALKAPHDFEYDKVFDQFIIFSKKRYVGNKYEESATEFKQTSMGIVMKRRDNAPILKTIYGGALKILLNERNVPKAAQFVIDKTIEMVNGNMSLSQLTITKSLSARYRPDYLKSDIEDLQSQIAKKTNDLQKLSEMAENRLSAVQFQQKKTLQASIQKLQGILEKKEKDLISANYPPHKILADRIAKRSPGNAPASGERFGFIYIAPPPGQQAPKLQGDRIEIPEYIRSKKLLPDYKYYIEHQLMKPIGQLFGLMVDKIPGYGMVLEDPPTNMRESIAIDLLFGKALVMCDNLAKRDFMVKNLGAVITSQPQTTQTTVTTGKRKSPSQNTTHKPKMKQPTMDSYFLTKMVIDEDKKKKEKKKKT